MSARSATARGGDGHRGPAGTVRIIGGKWKGRKLRVAAGVRPTPDRVRETLFNWLLADAQDGRVLDLFAGTGALGFEALSRGAREATLVEQDRAATRLLRRHRDDLDAAATIVQAEAVRWLAASEERWDVVLLDPPFAFRPWPRVLQLVAERLTPHGLVYLESAEQLDQVGVADAAGLHPIRRSNAGVVRYGLFERRDWRPST